MLHYIAGDVQHIGDAVVLIVVNGFGIQAHYNGQQKTKGEFFLHPYIDDNTKTISYFAFDTIQQKYAFGDLLKISGVGPRTAFGIANMEHTVLAHAVETFDVKALQSIPGVGPKTAKRLLIELKSTLSKVDVAKLLIDDKLLKSIVSSLKSYGYDASTVKQQLKNCPILLEKENTQAIIKRLISAI